MALDEAKNPQARDQKPNPVGAGVATGIGNVGNAVASTGQNVGSAPAAPSGGGGGGGGGGAAPAPDYSALAALSAAGLTSADIVALANRGSAPAPAAAPAASSSLPAYPVDTGFNGTPAYDTNFAAAPAVGDQFPSTDPQTLAILAAYDQQLNDQISGFRGQQDQASRNLADALPELARSFDLNRESVKDAFEGRGLLKSGETEQAVGRTYEDQGRRQSDLQKSAADQIANIEQQIAAARTANAIARNNAVIANAGNSANQTVGSVS